MLTLYDQAMADIFLRQGHKHLQITVILHHWVRRRKEIDISARKSFENTQRNEKNPNRKNQTMILRAKYVDF